MIHTGQVGDVVVGCFLKSEDALYDFSPGGTYSQILPINKEYSEYHDREEYLMCVRGFFGALSSHFYLRNYTEIASPFLDIEFFDFCMSIPVNLRANHYIYKKWILAKYPQAAKYIWEKTGGRINESKWARELRRYRDIILNPKRILRKLGFKISVKSLTGMNPFDLWWNENEKLRQTYEQYYKSAINNNALSPEIKKDIEFVYTKGNTIEKMLAITALAVSDRFFNENFILG